MKPGTIVLTVANSTPEGWLECRGQKLRIDDYPELFSAIGYEFGGDGVSIFDVPRLPPDGRGIRYIISSGKLRNT